MKSLPLKIISLLLVFIILGQQGFAETYMLISNNESKSAELFYSFDESAFLAEFDALRKVEVKLENECMTLNELNSSDFALDLKINPDPVLPFEEEGVSNNGGCNGFTAFLMGFGCGVIGVLIVYFKTEDNSLTTSSIMGCLLWSAVSIYFQVANGGLN